MKSRLRNQLSIPKFVIIDEISMVCNILILFTYILLLETFGFTANKFFPGITVIACDGLLQLPSEKLRRVYADRAGGLENLLYN